MKEVRFDKCNGMVGKQIIMILMMRMMALMFLMLMMMLLIDDGGGNDDDGDDDDGLCSALCLRHSSGRSLPPLLLLTPHRG